MPQSAEPGGTGQAKRDGFIRAWDPDGKEMNLEISGFPSRVVQHEIDHFSGILILDHISRLKRKLWIKKC